MSTTPTHTHTQPHTHTQTSPDAHLENTLTRTHLNITHCLKCSEDKHKSKAQDYYHYEFHLHFVKVVLVLLMCKQIIYLIVYLSILDAMHLTSQTDDVTRVLKNDREIWIMTKAWKKYITTTGLQFINICIFIVFQNTCLNNKSQSKSNNFT